MDARLVPPALGAWVAAGVAVGLPAENAAVAGLAGLLLAAVSAVLHRARGKRWPRRLPSLRAAATLTFAVTGFALLCTAGHVHARTSGPVAAAVGEDVAVVGTVISEPRQLHTVRAWQTTPDHRVSVRVAGLGDPAAPDELVPASGEVLVIGPMEELALGERVDVRGRLVASEPADRAAALLYADDPPVKLSGPSGHLGVVEAVRSSLRTVTADLSPQARGLVPGIAVGDDRALPAGLEADMKATSLTHLTAVSGAHVAILLGVVLAATAWTPRWVRIMSGAVSLVAFVALVRPEASVLRSSVMGVVVLVALLLGRPSRALPALGAAVTVLVLVDPWLARSYGFVLSVLATGGLVLLSRPWARWLSHAMPRWAATLIAVPASAQAVCAPVVLLLDPVFATYAVPANVLAAPAVPPATVLGVGAALLAPWWPGAATVAATAASWFTAWIAGVAGFFADLPAARAPWPGGFGGTAALAAVTVLAVILLGRAGPHVLRRAGPVLALSGGAALVVALIARPTWPPPAWVATQCDVGQGAAFVMSSGPGRAVLIDTGPPGGRVAQCLADLGVRELDLLVLTHAHADHVGALEDVLAVTPVHLALLGPGAEPGDTVERVLGMLAEHGAPVQRSIAGDTGQAGEVTWEVLWPTDRAARTMSGEAAVNDLSVVVRLTRPDVAAVALGDVEHAGQRGLVQGDPDPADVVVMAHHGSARQDPALAAALAPRLTLVSVGENDFGHPAPSALELYENAGGPVLRTDTCGDVAVVVHAEDLAVVCRGDVAG